MIFHSGARFLPQAKLPPNFALILDNAVTEAGEKGTHNGRKREKGEEKLEQKRGKRKEREKKKIDKIITEGGKKVSFSSQKQKAVQAGAKKQVQDSRSSAALSWSL